MELGPKPEKVIMDVLVKGTSATSRDALTAKNEYY